MTKEEMAALTKQEAQAKIDELKGAALENIHLAKKLAETHGIKKPGIYTMWENVGNEYGWMPSSAYC